MAEHQWERTASGEVNDEAFTVVAETTEHEGPRCSVCGFFFCIHCYADGWTHACPGPAPEGEEWCWIGDGNGRPPATPGTW